MATKLYRIIKYGIVNFWRQRLISLATLTVIVLAILVFQSLILFNHVATNITETLRDKIDVSVYFKTTAPEDDILRVKRSLEGLLEVKSVSYVARDEALQIFKEAHKNDTDIQTALEELDENPLSASLEIKAHNPREFPVIVSYLESQSLDDLVDKVSYSENQLVIDRLASIVNTSRAAGIALTLVLSLVAVIVAFNTILLAIYSSREEIGVMRLVGASNAFIRGPFIVEGIIYGILAAVTGVLFMLPIVYYVSPYVSLLAPGLSLFGYFISNILVFLGLQILLGSAIGVVSSTIAIRRYLKV